MSMFKEFLKEEENEMSQLAQTIINNGCKNNFLAMYDNECFMHRGSDSMLDAIQRNPSSAIVKMPKETNRHSTFSGNQVVANIWNTFAFAPRNKCFMASFNASNAAEFSSNEETVICIPADGTQMFATPGDWNLSFAKEAKKVFGCSITIGELGSFINLIFYKIYHMIQNLENTSISANHLLDTFNGVNAKVTLDFSAIINALDEIDKALKAVLIDGSQYVYEKLNDEERVFFREVIENHHRDKTMFDMLEEYMNECKSSPSLIISNDIHEIAKATKVKRARDEIWWTSKTLFMAGGLGEYKLRKIANELRGEK